MIPPSQGSGGVSTAPETSATDTPTGSCAACKSLLQYASFRTESHRWVLFPMGSFSGEDACA